MKSKLIKQLEKLRNQEFAARALLTELIPERRAIMEALYFVEGLTMPEIAAIYGVKDRRRIDNIIRDRHRNRSNGKK